MYNLKSGDGGAFPALDLGEVGVQCEYKEL